MSNQLPNNLTRASIAQMCNNDPRIIKTLENLLTTVNTDQPASSEDITILLQQVNVDAGNGFNLGQTALGEVDRLSKQMQLTAPALRQTLAETPDVHVGSPVGGEVLRYDAGRRQWASEALSTKRTQTASPSATGFSITVTSIVSGIPYDVWLLITPAAGYAAGTIQLPVSTSCIDMQEISVSCTKSVALLTVDGNGATVSGAPTALAADASFLIRYHAASTTWHRAS